MRTSHRCPKCQSTKIEYYDRIGAGAFPLLAGGPTASTVQVGPWVSGPTFRAYLCADCRCTEFYFM